MPSRKNMKSKRKHGRRGRRRRASKLPLTKAQAGAVAKLIEKSNRQDIEWRPFISYGDMECSPSKPNTTDAENTTGCNAYGFFKNMGLITKQMSGTTTAFSGQPGIRAGDQVTLKTIQLVGSVTANEAATNDNGVWTYNVPFERQFAKLFIIRIARDVLDNISQGSLTTFWEHVMLSLPMPQTIKSTISDEVHQARSVRQIMYSKPLTFSKKFYSEHLDVSDLQLSRAEPKRLNIVVKKSVVLNYGDSNTNGPQDPVQHSYFVCVRWGNWYERLAGNASKLNCPSLNLTPLCYYQDM